MIGDFYGDGNRYRGVTMVNPSVLTITFCETIIIEPEETDGAFEIKDGEDDNGSGGKIV